MKTFAALLAPLFFLSLFPTTALAEAYGSGWYRELQVGIGYEDNISRSFLEADEVSDETARISIGGGHSQKVGDNAQLVFYGYITMTTHSEYDDLDNIATTLGSRYTYQPNPGFNAIWINADVSATHLRYENSDGREGVLFKSDLNVNKRLDSRATSHLGYRYNDLVFVSKTGAQEERDAAFDTATHEIYLGLDYALQPLIYLYGEYAFRHGGAWSNSSFAAGIIQYDAETLDSVFDDCGDNPRCQPRYAGRTVNDTHRLHLGLVFPLGPTNIDLSAAYFDAEGDNGKNYKGWYTSIGLIWNF